MSDSFREQVLNVVRHIPKGQTMSYGDVAEAAGAPGAARAVGTIMKENYDDTVPCHRVIAVAGSLAGYGGGLDRKRWLLAHEGVVLRDARAA